jgi:hypothetical protein
MPEKPEKPSKRFIRLENQMIQHLLEIIKDFNQEVEEGEEEDSWEVIDNLIINKRHTILICGRSSGRFYQYQKSGISKFYPYDIEFAFDLLERIYHNYDAVEIITVSRGIAPIILRKGGIDIHIGPEFPNENNKELVSLDAGKLELGDYREEEEDLEIILKNLGNIFITLFQNVESFKETKPYDKMFKNRLDDLRDYLSKHYIKRIDILNKLNEISGKYIEFLNEPRTALDPDFEEVIGKIADFMEKEL